MRRTLHLRIILALFITALSAGPAFDAGKDDACLDKGIIVKNLAARDLWYKGREGTCYIWVKDHIFVIRPGDPIGVFSDMTCATNYCSGNPGYKDYKSIDENGDCRVRILPGCRLSDM